MIIKHKMKLHAFCYSYTMHFQSIAEIKSLAQAFIVKVIISLHTVIYPCTITLLPQLQHMSILQDNDNYL